MLFSRACEHGLSAMIYVAGSTKNGEPVRVRALAEALDISFPTLAKVVQKLAREGLVVSQKGPGGGIMLSQPAREITLLEIVEALEGRTLSRECILGIPGCSERTEHCALHDQWKGIRDELVSLLRQRDLEKVAEEMTELIRRSARSDARGRRQPTRIRRQETGASRHNVEKG